MQTAKSSKSPLYEWLRKRKRSAISLSPLPLYFSLSILPPSLLSLSLSLFPFSDFIMARNSSREIMGPARSEFCHYVVVLRHAAPWIGVMGQMAGGSSGDGGGDGAVSILIYLGALGLAMAERGVILRKWNKDCRFLSPSFRSRTHTQEEGNFKTSPSPSLTDLSGPTADGFKTAIKSNVECCILTLDHKVGPAQHTAHNT